MTKREKDEFIAAVSKIKASYIDPKELRRELRSKPVLAPIKQSKECREVCRNQGVTNTTSPLDKVATEIETLKELVDKQTDQIDLLTSVVTENNNILETINDDTERLLKAVTSLCDKFARLIELASAIEDEIIGSSPAMRKLANNAPTSDVEP